MQKMTKAKKLDILNNRLERMVRKDVLQFAIDNGVTYGGRGPMANKPILPNTNKSLGDLVQLVNDEME